MKSNNVKFQTNWNDHCMKFTILHLTTAHYMDDARIYNRECRSLAKIPNCTVRIAAHGNVEPDFDIAKVSFGKKPKYRLIRMLKSQYTGLKLTLKYRPSVWHLHDLELIPLGCILVIFKKKVIWDAHEDYFLQFESPGVYREYIPKFLRRIIGAIVFKLLKFLDKNSFAVIGATESIALRYKNSKTVVVGNEAIVDEFEMCSPNFRSKRILFTGPATDAQSFREVVNAVSFSRDWVLTLVGHKPLQQNWEFAKGILGDRIEYLGWKNRLQLATEISNSSVGLITYNNSEIHMTNSPNKLFEFSAGGLPCVATPTLSNRKWVQESNGAVLADGYTAEDLYEALKRVLSNKNDWDSMSNNLRRWSNLEGNWKKSEQTLLELYDQALS